jgi:hypothetical protein
MVFMQRLPLRESLASAYVKNVPPLARLALKVQNYAHLVLQVKTEF